MGLCAGADLFSLFLFISTFRQKHVTETLLLLNLISLFSVYHLLYRLSNFSLLLLTASHLRSGCLPARLHARLLLQAAQVAVHVHRALHDIAEEAIFFIESLWNVTSHTHRHSAVSRVPHCQCTEISENQLK